jgi:trehalose 6-phosphate synthase
MTPILEKRGGSWIGWSGSTGRSARPLHHDDVMIVPVPLSAREVETYYHGFSNATIWPLYHDAIRSPVFNRAWWKPYSEVNWRFAEAAARHARRNQVVWIHDYQLQLVPRMLRELRPDLKIGFFLHIPFPPDELFAWLPWRREILEGLLGADVVGFQTPADAQDFSRAARVFTSAEGTDHLLEYRNRHIRVESFPISIDFEWLQRQAGSADTIRRAQLIRRQIGPSRKILLSVDRIDYTKGIDKRLAAVEDLFRQRIVSVDDCVFVQIGVPSRESVSEYVQMRTRIEQMVGRINGEFSVPGKVAVHYFRRNLSREELVAYYAAADVMVVTPLRDGMNLVAKEYVATRLDNSGSLILSEFAGAARELSQALLVNPYDTEGMVRAFETALHMPRRESRLRMSILRMVVRRHNVYDWAGNFFKALRR